MSTSFWTEEGLVVVVPETCSVTRIIRHLPWRVSCTRADASGLLHTAEFDPLRDYGILYASKLGRFGVQVWDMCFAGQIHLLLGLPPEAEEIKEYETLVKNGMKQSFQYEQ